MTRELPTSLTWIDPGKTTGWATLTSCMLGQSAMYPTEWIHSFVTGQTDDLLELGEMLELLNGGSAIGWEAYLGHGGSPRHAHEVIGMARYLAMRHHWEILPEMPAASRVIVTIPMLKALGAHSLGRPHANDAARHLVAWLWREGLMRERLTEVFTSELSTGTIGT
jgi:hypothetical protein